MQKLPVYFAPTHSNRAVIRQLERTSELAFAQFLPLTENKANRFEQLLAIRGRAVYIWGDGGKHDESFAFTMNCGARCKLNIDHHDDEKNPRTCTDHGLNCGNHMGRSEAAGMRIIRPDPLFRVFQGRAASATHVNLDEPDVAITIDGDGIRGFPARSEWLFRRGATAESVIEFIEACSPVLLRLDFGGMVEGLESFDLLPRDAPMPSFREIESFCLRFGGFEFPGNTLLIKPINDGRYLPLVRPPPEILEGMYPEVTKYVIDRIGSFVVWLYADLICAFGQSNSDVKAAAANG